MPRINPANSENADDDNAPDWRLQVGRAGALDDAEPVEETAADRVSTLLQDLRGAESAVVKLFRVQSNTKKLAWCADYTAEEFERAGFEMIRTQWGPGAYEIRLYGPMPQGGSGLRGRQAIEIVAPLLPAHAAPAAPSEFAAMLATMQETQRQMLEAISAKPPPVDPMAQMIQMLGTMKMMREAMGMGDGAPPAKSSIMEAVEAIRMLREASEEINPPKDAVSDDPMAMLPKILELVKAGMSSRESAAPVTLEMPSIALPQSFNDAQARPAQPTQLAQPAPPETSSENSNVNPLAFVQMRAYLKTLLDLARAGKIDEGAALIYEKLPDEFVELMAMENWFDLLAGIESEAASVREQLTLIRDKALALFDQPETPDPV